MTAEGATTGGEFDRATDRDRYPAPSFEPSGPETGFGGGAGIDRDGPPVGLVQPLERPAYEEEAPRDERRFERETEPEDKKPSEPAAPKVAREIATAAEAHPEAVVAEAKSEAVNGATAAPRQARSQPVASEPVLERVVVRPEGTTPAPEAPSEDARPARRGWWQRRLMGE